MTERVLEELKNCDAVIGYSTYIEQIKKFVTEKEVHSFPMRTELKRAQLAIELAQKGKKVVLVSSGDPGIYGMASPLLEAFSSTNNGDISVEIIPGISSLSLTASIVGAPIAHDFAVISLSDLLTPWEIIEERLRAAAKSDFVIVLFNPKSHSRTEQIKKAQELMLEHKRADTPVAIVRENQALLTTLAEFCNHQIDMRSTVIIGNSQTYINDKWMITPRGYQK